MEEKTQTKSKFVFTAAFIIIFCCSASAAFSVFAETLQEATGGTAAQVALTLTIYQFFMALFGIISGRVIDKTSPKKLMFIGGIVFGLGWFLGAFANSIPFLYLSIGFLAGAGNGLLYNPALLTTLKWFPKNSGTVSGFLLGAASLGPLVLAKVGAILCDRLGQNGFIPIGIAYLVLVCIAANFMQSPTEEEIPSAKSAEKVGLTSKEMLKTTNFWLMILLFSIACTSGIMLIGSLSTIAQVQLSMSALTAANFVVLNTLSNFCGRLITGRTVDKLGPINTLIAVLIITIIGLLGLRISTNVVLFSCSVILLGASFGGVLVIFPTLTNRTFGFKYSGTNYGIMFFGYAIGSYIGPQIAARAADESAGTGMYHTAYMIAIGVAIVGILIALLLSYRKIGRKESTFA